MFPDNIPFKLSERTENKEHQGGYCHAAVFTSRTNLDMTGMVEHYDRRAGMEADLKSDKHGLGRAKVRKRLLPAQKLVVLLVELAHNILIWARSWLGEHVSGLLEYRIARLIGQVWDIPVRVKLTEQEGWCASAYEGSIPEHARCARGFCPCVRGGSVFLLIIGNLMYQKITEGNEIYNCISVHTIPTE